MSMTNIQDFPLPPGWIKELDKQSGHAYYVDTKADPPRSIWVHPYEDERYLREHPEVQEKIALGLHHQTQKRGFLGKLKDKAIGTKEEREAVKMQQRQLQAQREAYHFPQYMHGPSTAFPGRHRGGRIGGGGMAAPLMGGMAGGLLVGSAAGALSNDCSGFGGGGFGDCGGGDFSSGGGF